MSGDIYCVYHCCIVVEGKKDVIGVYCYQRQERNERASSNLTPLVILIPASPNEKKNVGFTSFKFKLDDTSTPAMDSPAVASIHPYNHDQDKKLFLFYVAKQCMEPLAVANRAGKLSRLSFLLFLG